MLPEWTGVGLTGCHGRVELPSPTTVCTSRTTYPLRQTWRHPPCSARAAFWKLVAWAAHQNTLRRKVVGWTMLWLARRSQWRLFRDPWMRAGGGKRGGKDWPLQIRLFEGRVFVADDAPICIRSSMCFLLVWAVCTKKLLRACSAGLDATRHTTSRCIRAATLYIHGVPAVRLLAINQRPAVGERRSGPECPPTIQNTHCQCARAHLPTRSAHNFLPLIKRTHGRIEHSSL